MISHIIILRRDAHIAPDAFCKFLNEQGHWCIISDRHSGETIDGQRRDRLMHNLWIQFLMQWQCTVKTYVEPLGNKSDFM